MSVIPFILNGNNGTIVDNIKFYRLDGDKILIQNFDSNQFNDANSCNVSYDLRVGDAYRDHREPNSTELKDNRTKIYLQPGSAVIIQTQEAVHFPLCRFGHIVPKVTLLQDGLSNTSSKVDPGYHGQLLITVFNLGKREIVLNKGQKFCTLYVLDIKNGVTAYNKPPRSIGGSSRLNIWHKCVDFIERRQAFISSLALIVSISVGSLQIWQLTIQKQDVKTQTPQEINIKK